MFFHSAGLSNGYDSPAEGFLNDSRKIDLFQCIIFRLILRQNLLPTLGIPVFVHTLQTCQIDLTCNVLHLCIFHLVVDRGANQIVGFAFKGLTWIRNHVFGVVLQVLVVFAPQG